MKCLNPYSDIRIVGHHLKVAKQPLLVLEQTRSDTTSGKHPSGP